MATTDDLELGDNPLSPAEHAALLRTHANQYLHEGVEQKRILPGFDDVFPLLDSAPSPVPTSLSSVSTRPQAYLPPATTKHGNERPTSPSQPNNTTGAGFTERRSQPHDAASITPSFMVSAPGKVIVCGEHAVVYGKAAIAAAISLRSYLLVTPLSEPTVSLQFPDIDLEHTWNIDDLPWSSFSTSGKRRSYDDPVTALDPELVQALEPHIQVVSPAHPEHIRKAHQASASVFLYLLLSLGSLKPQSCAYTLRSTIPIGAGLGSSASVAVCLSMALLLQNQAISIPLPGQSSKELELQTERINRWAFVGEMCFHGNPSGVDNTVSSGGKAILFQRKGPTEPPAIVQIPSLPKIPLLLVNTRQPRSTAAEVAKVAKLKSEHPGVVNHLLNAINECTESIYRLFTSECFDPNDYGALEQLGNMFRISHGLLMSLGVSHPRLERIRTLIDYAGMGWTKLTGAGGGGCAIVILKPKVSARTQPQLSPLRATNRPDASAEKDTRAAERLEKALEAEGFERSQITLTGEGVGLLWPAVVGNVTDEGNSKEIDKEEFLKAEGKASIEKLVGTSMASSNGVNGISFREGWKFWRT